MGSCVSLDNFSQIADNALKDVPRYAYLCSTDDVLICGETRKHAYHNLKLVLKALKAAGMVLSGKNVSKESSISFCGLVIKYDPSTDALRILPDQARYSDIKEFLAPTYRSSLPRFMVLIAQVSSWYPKLYLETTLMQNLIADSVQFTWMPELEQEFLE